MRAASQSIYFRLTGALHIAHVLRNHWGYSEIVVLGACAAGPRPHQAGSLSLRSRLLPRKGLATMRTRIIFALIAAIALAGCAGGGAGSPFPNPSSGGSSPMTQQEAAQSGADSAMSEIGAASLDSSLFSGSIGVVLSSAQAPIQPSTSGTCK